MLRAILLSSIILFLATTHAIAQNRFGLGLNLGTFIAKSPVSNKTNLGLDLSVGALFSVYKERFYLKPTPHIRMIGFETGATDPSRESYLLMGLGLEMLARFGEFEKKQVYPFCKIAYSDVAMTLTNGISSGNNGNQNILSGWTPSFGFGVIVEKKSFQLKFQYEILKPHLKYADDVTEEQKEIYNDSFSFNNASITLGYTFNRR